MLGGVRGEGRIVLQQARSPGFQASVRCRRLRGAALDRRELLADGRGVDVAHQAAYVLHLAAPGFVAADALRFEQRPAQLVVELEAGKLRFRQPRQRGAERLQLEHFALAPGLADEVVLHASYDSAPMPKHHGFTCGPDQLRGLAQSVLGHAKRAGASGADCEISESHGLSVTVRKGRPDTVEHNRDRSVGVSVYWGERPRARRGHASTSDFSAEAIRQTVEAAAAIARHTAEDDCAGLPDAGMLARDTPDLDLFHPWALSTEEAIDLARRCEAAAFAVSKNIRNSEGATVSAQHSQFVLANSLGFMSGYPGTRHWLACSVIAEDRGLMQRDDWYSASRVPSQLADPVVLGRYAGERALARLGARKIGTRQAPVLFEAPVALQLIGHFISGINGGNLYRKTSFLVDSLGKQVFSPIVQIEERPHERQGMASTPFDEEGVATRMRSIVREGTVEGYFLGSYSARKLGMSSTGSAGGHHNLFVRSEGPDFAGMLREMRRGLLVTDLMGQGVNLVTGDYSRGASGYWVEAGEIQFPVEEITIAGNLREMFKGIVTIGSDRLVRNGRSSGSILVENMTIAGD
jgi:PmbA protein